MNIISALWTHYGYPLLILLTVLFCGWLLCKVLFWIGKTIHRKKPKLILLAPQYFYKPFAHIFPVLLARLSLSWIVFPEQIKKILEHGFVLWLIAGIAYFLFKALMLVRDIILKQYDVAQADNLQARRVLTQIQVIEKIVIVVVVIVAVSVMLMTFETIRQIGVSILASAGLMGVIIGFAAQKSLATLVAGIQIAFTQPIRIDDVVIVEGEWGRIEEITLTYVVVKIWDQRRLVLPITYFIENPFQNWTRTNAEILGTVYIYSDYTIPVEKVRSAVYDIVKDHPDWDKRAWGLIVTNATEKTIEMRALVSASDASKAWNLRCDVREKLIAFLQSEYPDALPKVRLEGSQVKIKDR